MVNADKLTSICFSDISMPNFHNSSDYTSEIQDSDEKTGAPVETECDSE